MDGGAMMHRAMMGRAMDGGAMMHRAMMRRAMDGGATISRAVMCWAMMSGTMDGWWGHNWSGCEAWAMMVRPRLVGP